MVYLDHVRPIQPLGKKRDVVFIVLVQESLLLHRQILIRDRLAEKRHRGRAILGCILLFPSELKLFESCLRHRVPSPTPYWR